MNWPKVKHTWLTFIQYIKEAVTTTEYLHKVHNENPVIQNANQSLGPINDPQHSTL